MLPTFNNPDLPATRSEMALPLKVGNEVIGALDIQSIESDAFHTDDIALFNTLADQVAIAIYNNQLYSETLRSLNEAQNLHRQYLRAEWGQDTAQRRTHGYRYTPTGLTPLEANLRKPTLAAGQTTLKKDADDSETPDQTALAVPITVRGETIGVIHVKDTGEERIWTEDEVTVVNSVANQVAVALENARLFENTVRRAEREKKVLEITAQIRATNDPEQMMQVAVNELSKVLRASRTQIFVRATAGEVSEEPKEHFVDGSQFSSGSNGHNRSDEGHGFDSILPNPSA